MLDRATQLIRHQTSHTEHAAVAETFTAFALQTQKCLPIEQQSMGAPLQVFTLAVDAQVVLILQGAFKDRSVSVGSSNGCPAGKLSYCCFLGAGHVPASLWNV